ncbi:hypothetical protein [Candidatus Cardinium hertigii]|nr:hypothetical protein [Candidatus Cardinium hertigii]
MEHVLAMLLTTAVVVGFGTYKYLRDLSASKFKVMNLARNYAHAIGIEAIYNKANCHRIDSYYGNQLFQEMIAKLEASHDYLVKHGQQELIQDIAMLRQSMHGFHELFLQKSKIENSIELDSNCITTVSFKSTILKVLDHIQAIGEPVQLLLRNQVKTTQLSADPALFECLIMLNLWEISKSAQAIDHMVSLSIRDTTLQYGYAMDKLSNQVPLVLPALCFCFSTDTIVHTALPVYIVSGMVNAPLPTAAKTFYQIESRQITEAHGGYVEIIENESSLTCLYVLPIQGDKVMRFKNYKPADLVVKIS